MHLICAHVFELIIMFLAGDLLFLVSVEGWWNRNTGSSTSCHEQVFHYASARTEIVTYPLEIMNL